MEVGMHFCADLVRTSLIGVGCWIASAAFAGEDLPKHVVLVYSDARPGFKGLDKDDYYRLAAFVDRQGKPIDQFFDGFLILGLKAESGNGLVPDFGSPIQKADYDWFLGHVFEKGRQVASLEEAVELLPSDLRKTKQVILAIPYPSKTHSGETRSDMVSHFIGEAARRFEQGHFAWLHLNGFYWVEETVSGNDLSLVKEVANQVHARHLKFYWIPYFSAKGQEDWRACGFDCAMLQPNYAFRNVKPNRFEEAEAKRRNLGMTIEMEVARYTRNRPESPAWKDSFLKYVSAGVKHQWAALDCVGYYYGNDFVKMSRQPQDYAYYELIHKFINRTLHQKDLDRLAGDAAAEMAKPATAGLPR
jgi:hypothetical protein